MVAKVNLAHVRIDSAALGRELRGAQGPVFRHAVTRAENVRRTAQSLVGVDTGKLKASIVKRVVVGGRDGFEVLVGVEESGVPYALFHHEGTRPHVILPRNGRFLVFRGRDGTTVFARRVNHPGTKPNPFLVRAAQQEGLSVRRLFLGR